MKRTELEKKERELKKQQKKLTKLYNIRQGEISEDDLSESSAIGRLFSLFQFDENEIYNIDASDELLEFLMVIQNSFTEKEFENIIRKSIKKTKISKKKEAFDQIQSLLN